MQPNTSGMQKKLESFLKWDFVELKQDFCHQAENLAIKSSEGEITLKSLNPETWTEKGKMENIKNEQ